MNSATKHVIYKIGWIRFTHSNSSLPNVVCGIYIVELIVRKSKRVAYITSLGHFRVNFSSTDN